MVISKTTRKLPFNVFFYLSLFVFLVRTFFSYLAIEQGIEYWQFNTFLTYTSIFLSLIAIVYERVFTKNIFILCMIVGAMCVYMFLAGSSKLLLIIVLLVIASKGCNFTSICKFVIVTELFLLVSVNVLALTGVIKNITITLPNGNTGCYLGFSYISTEINFLFNIMMSYLYIKKNSNISWFTIILFAGINQFFYLHTDIVLIYTVANIALILIILHKKFHLDLTQIPGTKNFSSLAFPSVAILSIVTAVLYNESNSIWATIDRLLSHRLRFNHRGIIEYGINLLGRHVQFEFDFINYETGYFYIDNGFVYSLLCYGLIVTILITILYTILLRYTVKSNNNVLFIWVSSIAIYNLVNESILNIPINTAVFALWIPVNAILASKRNNKDL